MTFLDLLEEHFKQFGMSYWLQKHDLVRVKRDRTIIIRTFDRPIWENPKQSIQLTHDDSFVYIYVNKGPKVELARIADPQCFDKINLALENFINGLKVTAH